VTYASHELKSVYVFHPSIHVSGLSKDVCSHYD